MALIGVFAGCGHPTKTNVAVDEATYQQAESFYKSGRYEEAIAQFKRLKSKNPGSAWAIKGELRVADIYFEREQYVEAAYAYLSFKELHRRTSRLIM